MHFQSKQRQTKVVFDNQGKSALQSSAYSMFSIQSWNGLLQQAFIKKFFFNVWVSMKGKLGFTFNYNISEIVDIVVANIV